MMNGRANTFSPFNRRLGAFLLLPIFLALSTFTALAQSNLVVNGSFEAGPPGEGTFTSWWWTGPADNFSNYGVAPATGGSEAAQQGTNFAYFRGHPTDNSQDCLGVYGEQPGHLTGSPTWPHHWSEGHRCPDNS